MSGAKNCPETPRQKMISMMYLVLTAMLALNVSADILNGFKMVTSSMQNAINSSDEQTKSLFKAFEKSNEEMPGKYGENLQKAYEVQAASDSLFEYIRNFREEMIRQADGDDYDRELINIKSDADVNAPGNYGLRQNISYKGNQVTRAAALQGHISDYLQYLYSVVKDDEKGHVMRNRFGVMFQTDKGTNADGDSIPWAQSMFEYMPMAAVNALLTRYQNDVRQAQNEVIEYLYGETSEADIKVNTIEAMVIPSSRNVMRGGVYEAQIIMAAYDKDAKPVITVNGAQLGSDGIYRVTASGSGSHTYTGTLQMPGVDSVLTFKSDYFVTEPSATISNTDLNVVYRGIPNHFSVSVPGVDNSKVRVSATGGSIASQGAGKYIVTAGTGESLSINVSAEVEGRVMSMGSQNYRIKKLPDPKAFFVYGGKHMTEGSISRSGIQGASLYAGYGPDELIDAKFSIVGFTLVTSKTPARETSGASFSAQQRADLEKLKMGDIVVIKGIKAKGPDGVTRNLGAIQLDMR